MTDFKDSTTLKMPPVPRLVPSACSPVFDANRGPMLTAQPGTMMAAIVALESQRDFTRAKQVRALLKDAL